MTMPADRRLQQVAEIRKAVVWFYASSQTLAASYAGTTMSTAQTHDTDSDDDEEYVPPVGIGQYSLLRKPRI